VTARNLLPGECPHCGMDKRFCCVNCRREWMDDEGQWHDEECCWQENGRWICTCTADDDADDSWIDEENKYLYAIPVGALPGADA
jgi:hypothetical protein